MFQEAPIYRQLISERGDVPAQVRGEAERIRRDLQRVMPPRHDAAALVSERVRSVMPDSQARPSGPHSR
ncbi:hypothetical protein ACFV99_05320 [Streptomyces sp. NPDC059944]|uniref:hypothetical protein n=1 Tax=unclassified Streptomyces TaxID=2593676 RepID=UPI003646D954